MQNSILHNKDRGLQSMVLTLIVWRGLWDSSLLGVSISLWKSKQKLLSFQLWTGCGQIDNYPAVPMLLFPQCSVAFELFALSFTVFDFVKKNEGDISLLTQTCISKPFLEMQVKWETVRHTCGQTHYSKKRPKGNCYIWGECDWKLNLDMCHYSLNAKRKQENNDL